jgi:hypothetical protein
MRVDDQNSPRIDKISAEILIADLNATADAL